MATRGRTAKPKARSAGARDTILAAARELFGERGFADVSARDVARRADVTKALVFYHFESMEDLFAAVLDDYYDAQAKALEAGFEGEGTVRERLSRLLDGYIRFIDEHRFFPRLVQQEVRRGGPAATRIRKNVRALLDWTERALGDVLPPSGPLSARHFYLTIAGMVIHYYTYAPILGQAWDRDPLGAPAREERRQHLLWVVSTILDGLEAEAGRQRGGR